MRTRRAARPLATTLLIATVAWASPARAQPTLRAASEPHRWGIETELIQPFIPTVRIFRAKLTRMLWGAPGRLRGDVLVGVYIRPHIAHDVVEHIDEYMGVLGYRQFFWRGLHLDVLLDGGAAWGRNKVDGKDYRTVSLFGEVNAGYRLAFFEPGGLFADKPRTLGLFVAAQVGLIFSLGVADIGPRDGKPDWFVQGNLLLGVTF